MNAVIYKYTSPSGRCYIGQTIDEKRRKTEHKRSLRLGVDNSFYRAVRKYGYENFTYEVLFRLNSKDSTRTKITLNAMEKFYVKFYNSFKDGYNMTMGGDGFIGFKYNPEVHDSKRKSITLIKDGVEYSFNSQREATEFIGVSEISSLANGKCGTMKGYTMKGSTYKRKKSGNKPIITNIRLLKDGVEHVFESCSDFCNKTGGYLGHIHKLVSGKRKTHMGFSFISYERGKYEYEI